MNECDVIVSHSSLQEYKHSVTQNTYRCREVSDICTLQSLNTSTNEHSNTETDWLKY